MRIAAALAVRHAEHALAAWLVGEARERRGDRHTGSAQSILPAHRHAGTGEDPLVGESVADDTRQQVRATY
jgi:hypothetical protein